MGYAFIACKKINSNTNLRAAYNHNMRIMDVTNASKDLAGHNEELVALNGKTYEQAFEDRIASLDYYKNHKIRSNAVKAVEFVMTFSPSEKDRIHLEKWKQDNIDWLRRRFNADPLKYGDNVVSVVYHGDEAGSVHCHALVIPIDEKGKLNASHYIDGPASLREMQTDYGTVMKKNHGLVRGMEYSVAKHEDMKRFYTNMNKALEKQAPEILPGESLDDYKKRIDAFAKDMALRQYALEKKQQRSTDERLSKLRGETIALRTELVKTKTEIRKLSRTQDSLERTFGTMPEIIKKLEMVDNLKEAFDSFPDENERNYVRTKMNDFIKFGDKERKKTRIHDKLKE